LLAMIALVLASCGAPSTTMVLPTRVPPATALAQALNPGGTAPTPTTSAGASVVSTSTPVPVLSTAVPTSTVIAADPWVRTNCVPTAPQPGSPSIAAQLSFDIAIDATPTAKRISPLIYGLGVAPDQVDWYRDMGIRMVRWGGNHTTRHNWEINASNAGSDWNFANVSQGDAEASAGSVGDDLVTTAKAIGAEALLTVPAMGWVARNGTNDTRSAFVPTSGGPQLAAGSDAIAGYDPDENRTTTSIPSYARKEKPFVFPPDPSDNAVYQDEWVAHLVQSHGRADAGGLRFYALDNEPDLWSVTHRDVHPVRMGYDDMVAMWEDYADAIKDVDPSAQIVAPVLSGVNAMLFSELDRGIDNFKTHADRRQHGGLPFLRWFLEEARIRDKQAGRRRLDYVDVHFYPQNGVFPTGNDPATNALRLRSTQELWNTNYTSESWIGRTEAAQVALIPRLRDWVATHYPGTKIAITEWNFGADDTINGGLTIADVLGIFGREGVDMASYWYYPAPGGPGASAFKLYGNYDGCGRHFGDLVLAATSSDEQSLAVYAARDSFSADITVLLINKLPNKAVEARLSLKGFDPTTAQVYQFNGDHAEIRRLPDLETDGNTLSYAVPQYSATLLVFKQP
jgi:hypothetical protein